MALTIGVLGASGGLGASTLTATLAVRAPSILEDCHSALALDLDPRGGLDTIFGMEHLSGARWEDLVSLPWPMSADQAGIGVASLPAQDCVAVLAAGVAPPPDGRLVVEVLDSLSGQVDVVAVDCGHRPSAELLSRLHALVVLTRLTAKGVRDAAAMALRCELARTRAVLVSRGPMRDRSGPGAARRLQMPFLAHWADDTRLQRYEGQGILPGTRRSSVDPVADEALKMLQTVWLSALVGRLSSDVRPTASWTA